MRIEETIAIARPPEAVWAVLSDWERQAEWMPDVAWIRVTGADRGAGARLAVRTKVLGIPLVTDVVVVAAWEPPGRLAVRHAGLVNGEGEWRLVPDGAGTRFEWSETLTMPPPVLGAFALWLYGPVQRLLLRRSLRNLRDIVERGGPDAQSRERT